LLTESKPVDSSVMTASLFSRSLVQESLRSREALANNPRMFAPLFEPSPILRYPVG